MITVIKGDITGVAVDAIVNISPVPVEDALVAGDSFKGGSFIYTTGTGEALAADEAGVRLVTREALLRAEECGLHNIAVPVPVTGVGELDPEAAAKVMVSEARRLLAHSNSVENVIFSVFADTAFETFLKVARRDQVVCLGDSITYGYPGGPETSWVALSSKMVGLTLVNEGINGDSTWGMLDRLKYDVRPMAPAYVIILGGANDILLGGSVEEIQDNIKTMAAVALEAGICPVLVVPPPALPGGGFVPPGLAGSLAEAMATIGCWVRSFAEQERLPALDFYTPMLDPQTGKGNPHYFTDGAHPNQKGYRELARAAGQTLLRLKKGFYYKG